MSVLLLQQLEQALWVPVRHVYTNASEYLRLLDRKEQAAIFLVCEVSQVMHSECSGLCHFCLHLKGVTYFCSSAL